jgi:hypothetical protein
MNARAPVVGAAFAVAVLGLSACHNPDTFVGVVVAKMGGLYSGYVTPDSDLATQPAVALINEHGEGAVLLADGTSYVASLATTDDRFIGTFSAYGADGQFVNVGTATGPVVSRDHFDGHATIQNTLATFSFDYDAIYESGSGIASLAGNWSDASGSLTIDSTGLITGQDSQQCVTTGQVFIIETRFDLYRVSISVTCPGEQAVPASGLLARFPTNSNAAHPHEHLLYAAWNGQVIFSGAPDKV